MIREALSHLQGAEFFATVPLVAFVLIFIGVIIWTYRLDKGEVREWAKIPLENEPVINEEREKN